MSRGRRTPSLSRCAGTLLGIACLTLALAPAAHAGTYTIDNCPAAGNGDSGPWIIFGAPQGFDGSCSGGFGDFIGPLGGSMSATQLDGMQVVTPAGSGITIKEAKLWWAVPKQSSGADNFAIAADNTGTLGEAATPLNQLNPPSDFTLPSGTTEVTLADYCSNDDASAPCVFGGGENPDLELYGAQLTLQDTSLPSGRITGGALAGGGPLSGIQSLSYSASDTSSGVRLVQLRVDGDLVAAKDYGASCSYADFLACPPDVSDTIGWNTASVADGEHSLEVIVQSAAQNTTVVFDGPIKVQNLTDATTLSAPPGPGAPLGPSSSQTSSTRATGTPNGAGASEQAQLRLGTSPSLSRPFSHRALQLPGRLLNAQGQPIAGATLDVLQQLAGGGGQELIDHVTTRADGTFVASVPPGQSRTIELAYRAVASDSGYAAAARVAEAVGAGVKLIVKPHRTSAEGSIKLTGWVQGPIPPHGVSVALLVHYRGRWEPFRIPHTDGRGYFYTEYKFEGGVGRFPFRAEVLAGQSGFPYATGRSSAVDVSTW